MSAAPENATLGIEISDRTDLPVRIIEELIEEVAAIWNPCGLRFHWRRGGQVPERNDTPSVRAIVDREGDPAPAHVHSKWLAFIDFNEKGAPTIIHLSSARAQALLNDWWWRRFSYNAVNQTNAAREWLLGRALGRAVYPGRRLRVFRAKFRQ